MMKKQLLEISPLASLKNNLYMVLHFGGALQPLATIPITKITYKKLPAKTLKIMLENTSKGNLM